MHLTVSHLMMAGRDILNNFNKKHLKLMLDIFHLQQICDNVAHTLNQLKDLIGHVQIAQVPNGHEPDVIGELNFEYVFGLIEKANYNDWTGCEYKPRTTTIEGLKWLQKCGHQFAVIQKRKDCRRKAMLLLSLSLDAKAIAANFSAGSSCVKYFSATSAPGADRLNLLSASKLNF
uniref:Xylose isomerase-like TIM barrel domain-containing protein n=1 Tax=Glossina morsitans morsitans TaxID=37546 RepID=A0A1B0FBJ9_GLOMM